MANHKSASKRARQSLKRHNVNRSLLSKLRNDINKYMSLLETKKTEEIQQSLDFINSSMAKALKKRIIKKKFMSRKLSSLSKKYHTK